MRDLVPTHFLAGRRLSRAVRGAVAAVTATSLALFLPMAPAHADGSEGLGAPASVTLATGTGVVTGGVGLRDTQPGSFNLDVPGTVKQVLLYWTGHFTLPGGHTDDTVTINGHDVTGTAIGGPTDFFTIGSNHFWYVSYRADISALDLVSKGANTLAIGGMDFTGVNNDGNDGAAVTVVYDDGSKPATIALHDGLDLAFVNFASPLDTTVPQTFSFPPSSVPRTANLATIVSSIFDGAPLPHRPNTLRVTFDVGPPIELSNPWQSLNGFELDAVNTPIQIPALATTMTVQALSAGDDPPGGLPASLAWTAAGLSVPPPPDLTLTVDKTNDANGDGTFSKSEIAPASGADVPFRVVVTNTSAVPISISDLTDEWPGTVPFTPQGTCASLVGTTLDPGTSATCNFTVAGYSPPAGDSLVDTVTVGGELPGIPTSRKTVKSTSTVGTKAAPPAQPAISLTVDKTNDANGDGTFTKSESAAAPGAAVPFRVVITNPSTVAISLTALTDQWPGTAPFTPGGTCAGLIGTTLAPGASATCTFTQTGYAPPAKQSLVDTITVTGAQVGNPDRTVTATSDSTVSTVEVLAETVEKAAPAATTATPAATLPATGADTGLLLLVGLALLGVGTNAVAVAATRRRREPSA